MRDWRLRSELRDQPVGIERRIAERRGPERIEVRGEMPVHPVRLDKRHRRGDAAEQLLVDCGRLGDRGSGAVSVRRDELVQALRGRKMCGQIGVRLEVGPPLRRNRLRRIQVVDEELLDIAEIEVFEGCGIHVN